MSKKLTMSAVALKVKVIATMVGVTSVVGLFSSSSLSLPQAVSVVAVMAQQRTAASVMDENEDENEDESFFIVR